MKVMFTMPDGAPVQFIATKATDRALQDSSFRAERGGARAGNFRWWESVYRVLSGFGGVGFKELATNALKIIEEAEVRGGTLPEGEWMLRIEYPTPIGWDRSMPRLDVPRRVHLVPLHSPNKKWSALQVDPHSSYLAPTTKVATVKYTIEWVVGLGWRICVVDAYPGEPMEFKGDVTAFTGRVLFDLDHPGYPVDPEELAQLLRTRAARARKKEAERQRRRRPRLDVHHRTPDRRGKPALTLHRTDLSEETPKR